MTNLRNGYLLQLLLVAVVAYVCMWNHVNAALPSIEDISQQINRNRTTVTSLNISTERIQEVKNGRKLENPLVEKTLTYCFKENKRFLKITRHISSRKRKAKGFRPEDVDRLAIKFPSTLSETRVFDGTRMTNVRNNSIAEIHAPTEDATSQGSNFDVYYLSIVGWLITDPTAPADFEQTRSSMFFPEVFSQYDVVGIKVEEETTRRMCPPRR